MGASIIADWQQELHTLWSLDEYRKLGVYVR
jgi:hypothetical protein